MKNLNLHPIKKLEIILAGEHQAFVTDLLDRAGVKGYTIISNLSGKGSHGFHAGHVMFNEDDSLIMIIAAAAEELVAPILEGLAPFYNENSGVVFVSDIQVTRVVKFTDSTDSAESNDSTDEEK
jgi:nitrogen regulatory protein PII